MTAPIHIAQFNIARMRAPLDDPVMRGFVDQLDAINAAAERSEGFVWRFQTDVGNATNVRPYDDDRVVINMSVWASIEDLQRYVYRGAHAGPFRDRHQWFEPMEGPTARAFTVKDRFPAHEP